MCHVIRFLLQNVNQFELPPLTDMSTACSLRRIVVVNWRSKDAYVHNTFCCLPVDTCLL
uniref:Uncharacterized protein n=1 Tax=Arundo donax TaxID=35708 RepID=A0A0A9F3Z8_ARUDO